MRNFLLIITLLGSITGHTQTSLNKQLYDHPGIVRNRQAAKATTTTYSIQAYAYRINDKLTDTSHYYYSDGRGSVFADCYDNWALAGTAANVGEQPAIKADSFFYITPNNFPLPSVWQRMAYTYDANNVVTGITAMNSSYDGGYYKKDGVFTGNVLMEIDNADTNGAGSRIFTLKSKTYKKYDSVGRLICDSTYDVAHAVPYEKVLSYYTTYLDSIVTYYYSGSAWERYMSQVNTYDADGNLSTNVISATDYFTGEMKIRSRSTFAYNAYHALVHSEGWNYYNFNTSRIMDYPQSISKDTFAYEGDNPNFIYRAYFTFDSASNSWKGVGRPELRLHLNEAGQWDTAYSAQWDYAANAYVTSERRIFYYNTGGLIDSTVGQHYDTATHTYADTIFDKEIFYYNRTDSSPADTLLSVVLYPNPTNGLLNIALKNPPKGDIEMKMVNMLGQTVMHAGWDPSITQLDCSLLPAGVYLLMFYDGGRKPIYMHKVCKY